jgi:hypothetical protein
VTTEVYPDDQLRRDEESPEVIGVEHVGRDARNIITGTQGPVSLIETINWFAGYRPEPHGPLALDIDQEQRLKELFVEPGGWKDAWTKLSQDRAVLLQGEPNTGRRSAACRLLLDMRREGDDRAIQELAPQPYEPGGRTLDLDDVFKGGRFLLDLSEIGGESFVATQKELPGFINTVRAQAASLVVLLPTGAERLLQQDLLARMIRLWPPDGQEVLQRHLRGYGIDPPGLMSEELSAELRSHGPGQIALLAYLTDEARSSDRAGNVDRWLSEARKAAFDRGPKVAELVGRHVGARERALMLAAAMFDGASGEAVIKAERQLLEIVDHTNDSPPEFECSDLGTRLKEIEGQVNAGGQVEFIALNHSAAVRAHFWTHFPGLRDKFRDWIIDCGRLMVADGVDLTDQVARFADQCFQARRNCDVYAAVERWADASPRLLGALAGTTLAYGLEHPRVGWAFRQQCYTWATARSGSRAATSPRLADLVVAACRDVIAATHPEQAIVRLRHLSAHDDKKVVVAAHAALATVIGGNHDRLRYFLGRVSGGVTGWQRRADARCFLTVLDPEWLTPRPGRAHLMASDADMRTRLVERWRDAFSDLPQEERIRPTHAWLTAGMRELTTHNGVLSVVVEACDGRVDRVRELEELAGGWLAVNDGPPARTLVDQLITALDSAVVNAAVTDAAAVSVTVTSPGPQDLQGNHDE